MSQSFSRASRLLLSTAAIVIIIAGMKQASTLLVPFLLSVFIAVLSLPAMVALEKRGVPQIVALLLVILLVIVIALLLGLLVGSSVDDFYRDLPSYQKKITGQWGQFLIWLEQFGMVLPETSFGKDLDPGAAMKLVASILSGFGNVLANSFLILLTVVFILLEAPSLAKKLRELAGESDQEDFAEAFTDKLRMYMSIKTLLSLGTGVLVTLWLWILGVDYPQLWGVIAFMFNYVPNIGSIIAAVPAVLLALIQIGPLTALLTAVGYVVVNVVMGNVLEPRLMGRGLGLSTLVVFLSLVFWGWVLGPVGMLLSVPLTVTVKLALDSKPDTRWLGSLLGHAE